MWIDDLGYPGSVDKEVICVTDHHPGFPAVVCINRWLLELAADMFKTRLSYGHRYCQLGTKERYNKFKSICISRIQAFPSPSPGQRTGF
jgi:hypothetical protein